MRSISCLSPERKPRGRLTAAARDEIGAALATLDAELAEDSPPAPVLAAYRFSRDRRVNLIVFCRYCETWHFHGAGERPSGGDGHRVAHCHEEWSPYRKSGYILREVGPVTKEIRRDLRRRRARGVAQ
jgi:hypothetical protein